MQCEKEINEVKQIKDKKMENDVKVLKELYKFICVSEGIKAIALKFCKVGRGGACCSYVANKPKSISIDLNRINVGSAYALCHEVAHQICIANEGNATHNAKFKKMEKELVKKYANCTIARNLIW